MVVRVWYIYFINTALLVWVYVAQTTYMAAQRSAPLRSVEHTMMDEIINSISLIRDKYYNVRKNI